MEKFESDEGDRTVEGIRLNEEGKAEEELLLTEVRVGADMAKGGRENENGKQNQREKLLQLVTDAIYSTVL